MPNTPANDAPYAIGEIEGAATAEFAYLNAGNSDSFDGETINPLVVNADGSFAVAFAVSAPTFYTNFTVSAPAGVAQFPAIGGVMSEFTVVNAVAGPTGVVGYSLAGRDAAGNAYGIQLTPQNGRVVITEAMLANFAPNSSPAILVTGLAAGSSISGYQAVDVNRFYDGEGPTTVIPAVASSLTVPGSGVVSFGAANQMIESFALQNAAAWTQPSTVFRMTIATQAPLDLTGVSQTITLSNAPVGGFYRTTITVTPVDGVISVPETVLQQLESRPGTVTLAATGAVVGSTPQVQVTAQLPVTTITEGLYVQHFDASGNPTGEAVRVDAPANALLQDEDDFHYTMSQSADGGLMIAWLGNADEDDTADAVYLRELDTAGNPSGDTVALSGLSAEALDTFINDGGEADIAKLADGRFAVAYTVEADELGTFANGLTGTGSLTLGGVGGQLERVEFFQLPANGTITAEVRGESANGTLLAIPVSITNGVFEMTDTLRAQFAPDAHLGLFIGGLIANSPYSAVVTTRDIFDFSESSTLGTVTRQINAANNPATIPDAFISIGQGQTLSFQIDAATAAPGATPIYTISLITAAPINLAGLTQYTGSIIPGLLTNSSNTFVNGIYLNTIVVTPVNGLVEVPSSVLAQTGDDGLRSVLAISGLQANTPVNVGINIRHPSNILEPGVYAQTFDASGAAEGPAQRIDDADGSLANAATPDEDEPGLAVVADADGGFRVTWIANSNDDSGVDRIVSRDFDAEANAIGTAIDISAADIPGVVAAEAAGGEPLVPDRMNLVELGNGGFAALLQVDANDVFASFSTFALAPGNGNTGSVTFSPLRGQLDSVTLDMSNAVSAALASQPRAGFVSGKGLDGNPLQVAVTVSGGVFNMSEDIRSQFLPNEKLSLTVTGVTNPASPNTASFVFIPAFVSSNDLFTFDETSPILTLANTAIAATNPASPQNGDAFFGSGMGQSIAYQINSMTAAIGETPDFILYVTSEEPINTAGLTIYSGPATQPIYSSVPNNTFSPLGLFATTIAVTPVEGRIEVPQTLLDQFPHGGLNVAMHIRGLQGGTTVNVDTIVRQASQVLDTGLFVQLFDSAGEATGDFIRVDDPATSVAAIFEDYSQSSIQSDGEGGFRVVWKSDRDGDGDSDAFNIRHFDASGQQIGTITTLDSIPDRIYDEGAAVTLYTSGIFADPDPDEVLTFSATGLPNGLEIDPETGIISGTASASGLFAITVTVTDSGGLSASSVFELLVLGEVPVDENTAPTGIVFTNLVTSTPENGGPIKVSDLLVQDDGFGTNVLALSGADADKFSIVGNALYYDGGGDYETQAVLNVTVSVSDPSLPDAPIAQDFELLLTDEPEDVNTAPNLIVFVNTVTETAENGGALKVADILVADDGLGSIVLALSGADAAAFNIIDRELWFNGSGNYEGLAAYNVTVSASDPALPDPAVSADFYLALADVAESQNIVLTKNDDDINVVSSLDTWTIDAGKGNDTIFTGAGVDNLLGDAGDDTINSGYGGDTVDGGAGDDIIDGEDGDDTIFGGGDNDTLTGSFGSDIVDGGSGDDQITGGEGADDLLGKSGNDDVDGGDGDDIIDGGSGDDILRGALGNDTIAGGSGIDEIFGGDGDDGILGGSGNDTIEGEGGNDTIDGEIGDDFVHGGLGADLLDGGVGNDEISGDEGDDTINGASGNDMINGGDGLDIISGASGNDTINGGAEVDTIDGGSGDDEIYGEDGEDMIHGGSGIDTIDGGNESDTIFADSGNDMVFGGFGDDIIDGGNNDDTIEGNDGDDTILGGSGIDTISGGFGDDTIDGGAGDDSIDGDEGADVLRGGAGVDTIDGGADNDLIIGGAGTDLLTGGAGADTFVFELKTDTKLGLLADHVSDFSVIDGDLIDLSLLDANTRILDDQAFSWIGAGAFTKSAGQLRYEVIAGNAHITGDMNGDSKADFEIVLDAVTSLPGSGDFLIY